MPPLARRGGGRLLPRTSEGGRARFQPDEAVSEICRRLDDLPLALELAAARVKALSPTQILERLEQRLPLLTGGARDLRSASAPCGRRSSGATSCSTREEQRLFARLAVFLGGCTLEAAEDVAEADLDMLQSLVDKSLVRHAGERYWMLETIREYAGERLRASGDLEMTAKTTRADTSSPSLFPQTSPSTPRASSASISPSPRRATSVRRSGGRRRTTRSSSGWSSRSRSTTSG